MFRAFLGYGLSPDIVGSIRVFIAPNGPLGPSHWKSNDSGDLVVPLAMLQISIGGERELSL